MLVLKKENDKNWFSLKEIKVYKHKFIGKIMTIYYELIGYIVEVIEND
jgi:hypothetical protein